MKDFKSYLFECSLKGLLKNGFIIQVVPAGKDYQTFNGECTFYKTYKEFNDILSYCRYDVIDVYLGTFSVPYFVIKVKDDLI